MNLFGSELKDSYSNNGINIDGKNIDKAIRVKNYKIKNKNYMY